MGHYIAKNRAKEIFLISWLMWDLYTLESSETQSIPSPLKRAALKHALESKMSNQKQIKQQEIIYVWE